MAAPVPHSAAPVGLIGLGVMGSNLAQNLASRGIVTVVYNRTYAKTQAFLAEHADPALRSVESLVELVRELTVPRTIILMVDAGPAVDAVITELLPLLATGDCIVDGGNSFYRDTQRRTTELTARGLRFVGCGISGGAEGARLGPSLMPGGDASTWATLQPILTAIAARDARGGACVTHVGPDGAGHYVKMVHNGIEYAVMQTLAELVDLLRTAHGLTSPAAADVVAGMNRGPLASFLLETLVTVLRRKDDLADGFLIDRILDVAGQKGTGRWTASDAIERGVAAPSIVEAVMARAASTQKALRQQLATTVNVPGVVVRPLTDTDTAKLEAALLAAWVSIYAQGYDLIRQASAAESWGIDLAELSRIWQGGCIIRAELLQTLEAAYRATPDAPHLFAIPNVASELVRTLPALVDTVASGAASGVPLPGFGSALSYTQQMTRAALPANVLQGLRDAFGAHTYQRTDRDGTFTTDWTHAD